MRDFLLRLATVVLFPVNIAACAVYAIGATICAGVFWIITGSGAGFDRFFEHGPERIIAWPWYLRKKDDKPTILEEEALDMFHHASEYLAGEWRDDFPRNEAQANLDARAMLFNASNEIFMRHGMGVTRAEVEGACIIEKAMGGDSGRK